MKPHNKWNATILALVLGFVMSGCEPGQIVDSTQTSMPTLTATHTQTPTHTLTPLPTLTPTITLTPSPTLTATPIPSLPPGVENFMRVDFIDGISYYNKGLSFSNHEVNGVGHWATHLQNTSDDSHAPVYDLGLEFIAKIDGLENNIGKENLVSSERPVYKWFFGNIPEEPLRDVYESEAYIEFSHGVPFTPGFDTSLSIDKTAFSEPDIQTITITIVPRVKMTYPGITVHTRGGPHGNAAEADIFDISPGEHQGTKGEIISVSPDSKNLFVNNLPLEVDQPYTFSFSVKVKPNEPNTIYLPTVSISWCPKIESPSGGLMFGNKKGNTLAWDIDKIGTWTWAANGDYQLEWHGGNVYNVIFDN
jgi:hypothetical protein